MASDKKVSVSIKNNKIVKSNGASGGLYFIGFIGAAVYLIGQADGFWPIVVAFLKACVWPAFLVHDSFKFIYS